MIYNVCLFSSGLFENYYDLLNFQRTLIKIADMFEKLNDYTFRYSLSYGVLVTTHNNGSESKPSSFCQMLSLYVINIQISSVLSPIFKLKARPLHLIRIRRFIVYVL